MTDSKRISEARLDKLLTEFPGYVSADDKDHSEAEVLYLICTRLRDDLEASDRRNW